VLPGSEIVVVDNCSHDGTIDAVRNTHRDIRLIALDTNRGFGAACNVGVLQATRPYVLFLNPDAELLRVIPEVFRSAADRSPFGIGVPLQLEFGDNTPKYVTLRYRSCLAGSLGEAWRPFKPKALSRSRRVSKNSRVWASAALLLVRRDEFLRVGGFDTRFFLYYEDMDLCRRYSEAAMPLFRTTAILGNHRNGTSAGYQDKQRTTSSGWSLISHFQYCLVWGGERRARYAIRVWTASVALQLLLLRLLASLPGMRNVSQRKRGEIENTQAFVLSHAFDDQSGHEQCAAARSLLRRVLRPDTDSVTENEPTV
jgi:GT2 family glycosyltransferase